MFRILLPISAALVKWWTPSAYQQYQRWLPSSWCKDLRNGQEAELVHGEDGSLPLKNEETKGNVTGVSSQAQSAATPLT
jgi:hypothetical protein